MTKQHNVIILGSGPAGYTAALYAARAGLQPTLVTGELIGGQLVYTHKIENFPGFVSTSGLDLVDIFKQQVTELNVPFIYEKATAVNVHERPFSVTLTNGQVLNTHSLIIATGSSPKWLDVTGADRFKGSGISICATCDGVFYRGKTVAVIGGGNTALYEALFLASLAEKVFIINQSPSFQSEHGLQDNLHAQKNIEVLYNTQVLSFEGTDNLTSMQVKNTQTQELENISIDGAFIAIGQTPNTEIFREQLDMDEAGYLITDCHTRETSVQGVFAAGDVQEPQFRQAIISCGSGAIAAMSAEKYLIMLGK